jgi:hypothetical protein
VVLVAAFPSALMLLTRFHYTADVVVALSFSFLVVKWIFVLFELWLLFGFWANLNLLCKAFWL